VVNTCKAIGSLRALAAMPTDELIDQLAARQPRTPAGDQVRATVAVYRRLAEEPEILEYAA